MSRQVPPVNPSGNGPPTPSTIDDSRLSPGTDPAPTLAAELSIDDQAGSSRLNEFDAASLRLDEDAALGIGFEEEPGTVKIKKPNRDWFVRTHPDPAFRMVVATIERTADRELFIVHPDLLPDLRHRVIMSAFASKTGRCQPSSAKYVFGLPAWLRWLIKPEPGMSVACLDWGAEEYGVAAALSGDQVMRDDYQSDPYLKFGERIGYVPVGATKKSHPVERDQLKVACGLGAMYGAGPQTVADRLRVPVYQAKEWLDAHRRVYSRYWQWIGDRFDKAQRERRVRTVFGWPFFFAPDTKATTVKNFVMQGNGAELLRLAVCLATERGVRVDTFAPLSRTRTRRGMCEQASAWLSVVDGLPAVHARLMRVAIYSKDALEVICQQDGPDTLFYLDPPYLHATRTARNVYGREMTEADHLELLDLVCTVRGKVMISGYPSKLYNRELTDWHRVEFDLPNHAAGGKTKRRMTEVMGLRRALAGGNGHPRFAPMDRGEDRWPATGTSRPEAASSAARR
jgi:hypothetical protein